MKYAFMTFSTPDLPLADVLEAARRYGYDGVELRIDGGHKHGVERSAGVQERAEARALAHAHDVHICCIATGCRFADPATVDENVAQALEAIDLAADVDAGVIRVFGGKIPDGVTREQAITGVAAALRALAPRAEERGVDVAIETHDDWCDPRHVAAVLSLVDHPRIGVNWDYQHTTRIAHATPDEAFAALNGRIRHVHFHDGTMAADKLEWRPIGQGAYDHERVLQLLCSIGYSGFLSGEWIGWEPSEVHLPRELAAIRDIEASACP